MTDKKEKTDNELIRDFMGIKTRTLPNGGFPVEMWYREGDYDNFFSPFEYSEQWNYIMPVVEKIESLNFDGYKFSFITGFDYYSAITWGKKKRIEGKIESSKHVTEPLDDKGGVHMYTKTPNSRIESYYGVIVEFIKWYNEQRQS